MQEGGCVFGKANVARLRYDEALAAQFADGVFLATEKMIDSGVNDILYIYNSDL